MSRFICIAAFVWLSLIAKNSTDCAIFITGLLLLIGLPEPKALRERIDAAMKESAHED